MFVKASDNSYGLGGLCIGSTKIIDTKQLGKIQMAIFASTTKLDTKSLNQNGKWQSMWTRYSGTYSKARYESDTSGNPRMKILCTSNFYCAYMIWRLFRLMTD